MEAGKSTLLGVLTQGELDNGRGRARLNLFRHLHEIQSGRTSSISHEILGFDATGEVSGHHGLVITCIFRTSGLQTVSFLSPVPSPYICPVESRYEPTSLYFYPDP